MSSKQKKTAADVGQNSAQNKRQKDGGVATTSIDAKRYKKNAFRRLAPGAYRPAFIKQVKSNIRALSLGEVDDASMVRFHDRSLTYRVRVGIGSRNHYVQNGHHPQGEYLDRETLQEAIKDLHTILREAEDGIYDEALDELLDKRQKHAKKMADARKVMADKKGVFASPSDGDMNEAT